MKTFITALVALTLLAGCMIVPLAPYHGRHDGPHGYGGHYDRGPGGPHGGPGYGR